MVMLSSLLLAWPLVAAAPAQSAEPVGVATARNQVLRQGCHAYPFTYRVNPPPYTSTWSAEVLLIGPRGGKLGSAYFLSPADTTTGKWSWRLCRTSLVPGTYTMKMRVTSIDIYDLTTSATTATTFRITRR